MKIFDRVILIEQLELHDEGIRLQIYPDKKGIPTIGIGRNLKDRGISKATAYQMVHEDIDEVEASLDRRLPWWRRLDLVRQHVLANMCFQLGISRLLLFEKFLAHAMIGEYDQAAAEMLDSQWAREDSPKRALRLAVEMRHGGDHVAIRS